MTVIWMFSCWFVFSCMSFSLSCSFICFIFRVSQLFLFLYQVLIIASSIMLSVSFVVVVVNNFLKDIWIMELPGLFPALRAGRKGVTKSSTYK